MGVNITTIAYLRVLIIEIGSTIILMVVEAQGIQLTSATGLKQLLFAWCEISQLPIAPAVYIWYGIFSYL